VPVMIKSFTKSQTLYEEIKRHIKGPQIHYLLFDEIQEVEKWEKTINSLKVDFNVDIYLTGSNSHLLSSDLATFLAGRYIEIPIYTLSFKEFLDFRNTYGEVSKDYFTLFRTYLRKGGFPVIHAADYDEESADTLVRSIYDSIVLKDSVQRYKIRNLELFNRVVKYAFDNIGNTFSGKNVADYFKSQNRKVDLNTVYNYLYALEGAFILYKVSRIDIKGKEILKTQEKFYLADISLLYATIGYKISFIAGILENIIFLELKRRGYGVFIGKWEHREIDFVGEKKGARIYIQVAYKLESSETIEREFNPLISIEDHYPKYVVTMDEFFKDNIKGVQHVHVTDFLLANNW
jgi:predicted AAA+ superfamily ATPase